MRFVNQFFGSTGKSTGIPFISVWNTANTSVGSSASNQVSLPLVSNGTYSFFVDWGDGTSDYITSYNQAQATHTYSSSGIYTITISGICRGWQNLVTGGTDRLKIINITQWGDLRFVGQSPSFSVGIGTFSGCSNLNVTATDTPNFSGSNGIMRSFFEGCTSLTGTTQFNDWDVSGINDFRNFFNGCSNFNRNIGSWNMSAAITISGMFTGSAFNNGGSNSISSWNVSNVTEFGRLNAGMFMNTPFNQPIGSWNVSNGVNFQFMFFGCTSFNQNLGSWNIGQATDINSMFRGASSFTNASNASIGSWNVSNVTNFDFVFFGCTNFNHNLGSWNVSNGTRMNGMFTSTAFNNGGSDSIKDWNVSNVTLFGGANSGMFMNTPFNQPIGSWNMSSAQNLTQMFRNNQAFDQNIGAWNVINVTNFTNFMQGKTSFSTANLDAIYNGWSAIALRNNQTINFNTLRYSSAGASARAFIIETFNWTITDGGLI